MKMLPALLFCVLLCGVSVDLPAEETSVQKAEAGVGDQPVKPDAKTSPVVSGDTLPAQPVANGVKKGVGQRGMMAQPSGLTNGIVQVTLGLFVVLMVIAGAAWFVRRFGHFNMTARGNLRIIGGLHMGSRERVVLMQVGNTQLLLGVAPGRIQTLHVLDQPLTINDIPNDPDQNPIHRFSTLLKKVQQR